MCAARRWSDGEVHNKIYPAMCAPHVQSIAFRRLVWLARWKVFNVVSQLGLLLCSFVTCTAGVGLLVRKVLDYFFLWALVSQSPWSPQESALWKHSGVFLLPCFQDASSCFFFFFFILFLFSPICSCFISCLKKAKFSCSNYSSIVTQLLWITYCE